MTQDEEPTVTPKPKRRRWSEKQIRKIEGELSTAKRNLADSETRVATERLRSESLQRQMEALRQEKIEHRFQVHVESCFFYGLTNAEATQRMVALVNAGLGKFVSMREKKDP